MLKLSMSVGVMRGYVIDDARKRNSTRQNALIGLSSVANPVQARAR